MNNELVKMVADKIGVSQEKANTAAETVVGYLKGKLPQPIASQIDNVVSGSGGGLTSAIGDVLGRNKE